MAQYWLVKSEPDECGIDDFVSKDDGIIRWDGVRNYQARNFLREMQPGDLVYLYHSSCAVIGIAGALKVVNQAYPDPLQFDANSPYYDAKAHSDKPRWSAIDLQFLDKFASVIPLKRLKHMPQLTQSMLLTRPRLSVMPLTNDEWLSIQHALASG